MILLFKYMVEGAIRKRNSSKMISFMMDVRNTIALGMTITKGTIKNLNIYFDLTKASSSRFEEWDSASSLDSAVQMLWRRDSQVVSGVVGICRGGLFFWHL